VHIGVSAGQYRCLLNTDAIEFGGSGFAIPDTLSANEFESHGQAHSIALTLPPLSTMFWIAQD
jgi:1,4-alpha-glucan branching enzyme